MGVRVLEGHLRGDGLRVAIVVARTNGFVTERLLDGALDALRRTGVRDDGVEVVRVPGALEVPAVARTLVRAGGRDAVVCLGLVLRGATPHFEHVARAAVRGVARVALGATSRGVAVTMGILTCDTLEQAIERAGVKAGNKGAEAALAAVELCDLRRRMAAAPEKAPGPAREKPAPAKGGPKYRDPKVRPQIGVEAPRPARREAEGIPEVFRGRATQPAGMHRRRGGVEIEGSGTRRNT